MSLDWLMAFCAWLPLPYLAWLSHRIEGKWLAPGALAALTWSIAAGVPLWFAPDLPVHPGAYAIVLCIVGACVLASAMGASLAIPSGKVRAELTAQFEWPPSTWRLYYIAIGIGFVAPVLLYFDATHQTRAGDLAELAMYTSMGRYGGEYTIPSSVRLLTACTYAAATVAGVVTGSTPAEQRKWTRSLAWILPLVATVVIHTEKAQLLYGLVLWAAGWAAGTAIAGPRAKGIRGTTIFAIVAGTFALVAFFVVAQSMRMNRVSLADIPFVLDHLRIYVVGHMPVFGHWWTQDFPRADADGFGTHTFAGLAELAGLTVRRAGLYEGTSNFTESNIYTAWRPLFEDFGVVGAIAFMSTLAGVSGFGWRMLRAGRCMGAIPVVGFTAYVLWSPITSIFVYSTIIAVVVLFGVWTFWVDLYRSARVERTPLRPRTLQLLERRQ